jgi:FkbM family methyltransferase
MTNFYSQFGEDKWIVENLRVPPFGVFVDVGAMDGITSSNTLHFEEQGWHGLCIEPDPRSFKKCQVRRRVETYPCACGNQTRPGTLFAMHENPALSGFLAKENALIRVLQMRLDDLLHLLSIQYVDILSIDTESTELDVWEGLGSLIRPRIVIIEYYSTGYPKNDVAIVEQFTKDGYVERHRTEANIIFTHGKTP